MKTFILPAVIAVVLVVSCWGYNAYLYGFADEMTGLVSEVAEKIVSDYPSADIYVEKLKEKFDDNRVVLFALMHHDTLDELEKSIAEAQVLYRLGDTEKLIVCLKQLECDINAFEDFLPINLSNVM